MAFVIQTNVMSLNAQRNLDRTQGPLQQAMQRLSSGYRINSAKDDAAGLAISTRMSTQIRGLGVSVRNASDAISLSQTAEGAMDEIVNNLQRIRELGVQSMSGQYSVTDVAYMQREVNSLVEEIGRIAEQTKFNNERVLAGGYSRNYQVSASASDSKVDVTIGSMNVDVLGGSTFDATTGLKTGTFGYLMDVHTTTDVVAAYTDGVANGGYLNTNGATPPFNPTAYSYYDQTTGSAQRAALTYAGTAALQVSDSTSSTGFSSRASNTVAIMDGAINMVLEQKATMGAKSNQFEAIIRNLENISDNTQTSRSRIMDADFASETANLTKSLILQQSGISILSQANTLPQNVLNLLR